MERLKEGPLSKALRAGREEFNRRFARAARLSHSIDAEAFSQHMVQCVAPVVEAVAALDQNAVFRVTDCLFDISLEMLAKRLLSISRYPEVGRLWTEIFPSLAEAIIHDPRGVCASLTNALYNLYVENGRVQQWLSLLKKVIDTGCPVDSLRPVGFILAWRCGLSHFRKKALQLCDELDEKLLLAVFGLEAAEKDVSRKEILERLKNPWLPPRYPPRPGSLKIVCRIGGFRGFDGSFVNPPEVLSGDERLFAFDDQACWEIFADCFGATLRHYGKDLPEPGQSSDSLRIDRHGKVSAGNISALFPDLAGSSCSAATTHTLAVTLPSSHFIYLVALASAD